MPQPAPDRIYLHVPKTASLFLVFFGLVLLSSLAAAQTEAPQEPPQVQPRSSSLLEPPANPSEPQVSFDWVTTGPQPEEFSITVISTGSAALEITDRSGSDGTAAGSPLIVRFVMTEPNRGRVFQLAKQANFFQGDFDYRRTRVANTGIKTLTYTDAQHHNFTTFNWSQNKAIQQLTDLFSGIYWTEHYGRILQQQHRYDKLGLNDTLGAMLDAARRGEVTQLQLVEPVLLSIAQDDQVMNIARMRARKLLQQVPESGALDTAGSRLR